jgi:hypothetical protein
MQRMTFELPDESIAMAFTIVTKDSRYINTFTECHSVVDGQVFTLVDDGKDGKTHYVCRKSKENKHDEET